MTIWFTLSEVEKCAYEDLNLDLGLRKPTLYPLNYRRDMRLVFSF